MIIKSTLLAFILTFSYLLKAENISQLKVPDGFEIQIFADNLDSPRQITETKNGHVIVGSKKGDKIIALIDDNKDGIPLYIIRSFEIAKQYLPRNSCTISIILQDLTKNVNF